MFKIFIIKLLSFCLVSYFTVTRTVAHRSLVKILQNQGQYNKSKIFFDHGSEKNGTLLYMLCDRSINNMSCTIFREKHYIEKLPRIELCNVTFKVNDPYVKIGESMRVVPLSATKGLILWTGKGDVDFGPDHWGYKSVLIITIVDFETCKKIETTLPDPSTILQWYPSDVHYYPNIEVAVKSAAFAVYDDVFDIAYQFKPGTSESCKQRFDKNTGEIISNLNSWLSKGLQSIDILPKNPRNPDGGNFIIDWEKGDIYVHEENSGLTQLPSETHLGKWKNSRFSAWYFYITVCKAIHETKVKCDQIDYNGKYRMQVELDLKKKNFTPVPYSWWNGGFLLLTTECDSNCTERTTNQVYKVDTDGKLNKLMDIENFSCNINKFNHWHKFFVNDQGNICVSLLCYESKRSLRDDETYINTPEELEVRCITPF